MADTQVAEARLASISVASTTVDIVDVYDGDTFTANAHLWPGLTVQSKIRIKGIDTPERRTKCDAEKQLALMARARLTDLLSGGQVMLTDVEYGKWAGRVIATVWADGRNIADILIAEGHARPYDGKGARHPWC